MSDRTCLKDVKCVLEDGELNIHGFLIVLFDVDCKLANGFDLQMKTNNKQHLFSREARSVRFFWRELHFRGSLVGIIRYRFIELVSDSFFFNRIRMRTVGLPNNPVIRVNLSVH